MRSPSSLLASSLALASLFVLAARGAPSSRPLDPRAQQELSADFSLGKVVDREGVALARAATDDRWRSADENLPLLAGESLKTGARGANALHVRLKSGATLILGPDALVTLEDAKHLHVHRGEVEIGASEKAPLVVAGPNGATLDLSKTAVVRARDGKLARLDDSIGQPKWLAGYKAGQSTEALGSLLANVDGRDVPLTLGYHKVTVDVRDQIARTVIEESFLNHTDHVLEGVFYFPLPGDASISSFGMWIGDELVEGDIVEKERARAIYEQILREKRDPGLLEWSGGNVFKARVYPISGEKRVKIGYTQVLPKEGDVCAYHYALQSELLKLHPLRQLAIEVHVSSAEPLAAVASPSHDCHVQATEHAATVSFDAEEFTPDRDFELRIATRKPGDAGTNPGGLTLVADRRGEEGYFLVRFAAPPAAKERDAARASPRDWLILADTSGSMNGPARETQISFVEALLQSLAEGDTFQLATCDVETRFAFPQPVQNGDESRAAALRFLEQRDALGWSDLAAGFGAAFAAARPATQIVYVGDGQPTLGDADPGAFAQRLPALFAEKGGRGSVHAVVPGSTSEPIVLRALSMLGAGSLRTIGGGTDPTQTAEALVEEITSPRVTNLKVAFEGISVAAVHPETLPNLTAGRQQIVVGRFDAASGADGGTRGRVKVTGSLDGRTIEYAADVDLADRGEKESFIPRLWARHHLDELLSLGASPKSRERIIALSEEFQIATPYTSFLVLESEADRERFQVEKRTRMRNGEEFFAKGRADAAFELLREQMKKAGLWHRGLRDDLLAELATMGRETTELLRPLPTEFTRQLGAVAFGMSRGGGGKPGSAHGLRFERELNQLGYIEGEELRSDVRAKLETLGYADESKDAGATTGAAAPASAAPAEEYAPGDSIDADALTAAPEPALSDEEDARSGSLDGFGFTTNGRLRSRRGRAGARPTSGLLKSKGRFEFSSRQQIGNFMDEKLEDAGRGVPELDSLFPPIPPPAAERAPPPWPDDMVALLRSLDRRAAVAAANGRIRVATSGSSINRRGRTHLLARAQWLLSKEAWLLESGHRAGEAWNVDWLRGSERGVWRADWRLGRVRAREPGDENGWSGPYAWAFGDLGGYRDWTPSVRDAGDGKVELRLVSPQLPDSMLVLVIDRAKTVVVEQRWMEHGELRSSVRFSGFVEVAGAWWPTKSDFVEKDGRIWQTVVIAVEALDPAAFNARLDSALAPRATLIELGAPPKDLAAAKQAVADGKARLEDHWLLLLAALARGETEKAAAPLDAIRRLAAGRLGLERIELGVLARSRHHEELRLRLLADAAQLAGATRECELAVGFDFLGLAAALDAGNERLELLRRLEPVVRRQKEIEQAGFDFDQQVITALAQANRADELFAAQEKLARDWPEVVTAHTSFASVLAGRGEIDRALAWLDSVLSSHGPWEEGELEQLSSTRISILWSGYRLEELIGAVEAKLRETPERANAWQLDQYLSAIVMLDREAQWWSTIERWLGAARAKVAAGQKLADGERARVEAAIRQAIGQGYSCWWYDRRFEPREAEFLASVARALIEDERDFGYGHQILTHGSFRQTPAGRAVLGELYAIVETGVATLPARRLVRLIQALRGAGFVTDDGEPGWQKILDGVLARFTAATDAIEKAELENVVMSHGRRELALAALRHRFATATHEDERGAAAHRLLSALLQEPWTSDVEDECLRLLPIVGVPDATGIPKLEERGAVVKEALAEAILTTRILAWHDFVTWAVDQRAEAAVKALPDVNSMARRKLKIARDEQTKIARAAVRERLALLAAQAPAPGPVEWLKLDRAWLEVLLKKDVEAARVDALALLRNVIDATSGREEAKLLAREQILAARSAATLLLLLTKDGDDARPAHERELVVTTDAAQAASHPLLDWRELDYERLVVLDRGDALEAKLSEWFGGGDQFTKMQFGRQLAWIRAERGKLDEAARVMEQVAKVDELAHEDWLALADWHTALDRKDDAARAKLAAWNALGENELSNRLNMARSIVQNRGDGVPAELDPAVADQLVALMRKAQWPANHLWQIHNLYGTRKDFRLLQCLPDAVIGHSAQGVYQFLAQLAGIQGMVDEEATVDRVVAQIDVVMARATTAVDRRALHLLRFLAQWKAAAQKSGGGPHAQAALAAMKAAFDFPLAEGEARHLAGFLSQLGAIADPTLRAEQLRQLNELVRGAPSGSEERLALTAALALVQWQAGAHEAALRTLSGELVARRAANGGRLPDSANDALVQCGGYFQNRGDHLGFERLLKDEIAAAPTMQRKWWLENVLHGNYVAALRAGTRTSLGEKRELYAASQELLREKALARTNESQAAQLLQQLVSLWTTARDLKMVAIGDDVERFAFDDLPDVLAGYQYRNGQHMVGTVANALHEIAGPDSAVEFLVTRAENEPHWLVRVNQEFWDQHAWAIAQWRKEAGRLDDAKLERRLLVLTVKELRAEMRFGEQRGRGIYDQRWDTFWREKRKEFADAVRAELAAGPDDELVLRRSADYLFHGLSQFDDAIARLAQRHQSGRLELDGQQLLCQLLHERKRFTESVPILAGLIVRRPDDLDLRVMQMIALDGSKEREALEAARSATESHWREKKLWNEGPIATLAKASFDTDLFDRSVSYYAEAIALHVKAAPNRGVGDGRLAEYYGWQAQALAGLGRTSEAVDAAAGAVVAWGGRSDQRKQALDALEQVLFQAESLDAYAASVDAEVRKSGLENPTIRRALGKVYERKSAWEKAAAQFRAVLEVTPNDVEVHQLLVEVYDVMNQPERAVLQLFSSMEATGHDVTLMRELGRRLVRLGDAARAERVHTNLVEMLPNESESHQSLAEVREQQKHFPDAAEQWRQVIRVRSKEPTGYLGLARALLAAGEKKAAREPLETLIGGTWEERFGDVKAEARELLRRVESRF